MGDLLSREAILAAQDLRTERVEVPAWGGAVLVRTMTGAERDAFESAIFQVGRQNYANLRARLVAATVVDDQGRRLFTPGDVEALGQKSALALDAIFAVACRLNGIGARDVEELAGNSGARPGVDTSSG